MSTTTDLQNAAHTIEALNKKITDLEVQLQQALSLNGNEKKQTGATTLKREQQRLTKGTGKDISEDAGRIGGPFTISENPAYLEPRIKIFEELYAKQQQEIEQKEKQPILIHLFPDRKLEGKTWETTPLQLIKEHAEDLLKSAVVAKVRYSKRYGNIQKIVAAQEEMEEEMQEVEDGELWDLSRPLEGDCELEIMDFSEPEGKMVFWHSSAHLLGECLEYKLGSHLTVGPPIKPGFYYDSYIGGAGIPEKTVKELIKLAQKLAKQKQVFQRLVLTKEDALKMFAYNPYKVTIIKNKVQDGALTSVYRNGPFVDLCMGPHIVNTGQIKVLDVVQATSAYWLGNMNNDKLQRIYGISFPEKAMLKEYKLMKKEAEANDHRKKGTEHDLFFFHQMSPGSCFWTPHGAKIYNKLLRFIQKEERDSGYVEVITPNVYSADLWKVSGHWQHYQDDMFTFTDGETHGNMYGLKPMNCPGHCLIFDNRVRSYRDLPIRMADFGVLHRNEASGALSGLTRVRRFQQDDGHIFCRQDQVATEVLNTLNMIKKVYDILGLGMKVKRSTRPAKAIGLVKEDGSVDEEGVKRWDIAEAALAEALNEFAGKGNWKDKVGDGAFYGPKIDIQILDAFQREHQCATVQLDFQLPIRFNLKYTTSTNEAGESNFERPVIVHRAVLGSLERMTAILTEHFKGKWPFWLSPRQIMLIPVAQNYIKYAEKLRSIFFAAGFEVEVDTSTKTLNKKILLAQKQQFNFMFVVGEQEEANQSVNIRTRRNNRFGEKKVDEAIQWLQGFTDSKALDDIVDPAKTS